MNREKLNEGNKPEETPEQRAFSEQLKQIAENSAEIVDPENDIRNLLQEEIDKLRGSLQHVEDDAETYESFKDQIKCTERLFNKASVGKYFDTVADQRGSKLSVYDQVKRSPGYKPEEPDELADWEKRKARAEQLLKFMDGFKSTQTNS